jgi:hypothetical protein
MFSFSTPTGDQVMAQVQEEFRQIAVASRSRCGNCICGGNWQPYCSSRRFQVVAVPAIPGAYPSEDVFGLGWLPLPNPNLRLTNFVRFLDESGGIDFSHPRYQSLSPQMLAAWSSYSYSYPWLGPHTPQPRRLW